MNNHTLFMAEEGEETLPPFINILENGEPEDGFEENGTDGPAKVAIAQNPDDSEHRWDGYLKIDESANYYFRVDADDTGSITINDKGFTVSTGGGSLVPSKSPSIWNVATTVAIFNTIALLMNRRKTPTKGLWL